MAKFQLEYRGRLIGVTADTEEKAIDRVVADLGYVREQIVVPKKQETKVSKKTSKTKE